MRNKIVHVFFALLWFANPLFGQVCADYCYDPIEFSGACDPCATYVYDPCLYDVDDCFWGSCGNGPHRFYLGPIYYYRRTDFILNDCTNNNLFGFTSNSRIKGQFVGVNFGYEFREICCWYFRADGIWSTGTERPCPRAQINDWQAEGRVGYTWGECVPAGYAVSPYVGVGYLWQNRNYRHFDFRSNYQTWYVPIGVYADVEVMYGFTAGVDFAFAPFFASNIRADHSTFDFDKNRESRNRYLWRVSIPLRYKVLCGCGFEVSVEPFWEQYNFGRICAELNPAGAVVRPGIPQFRENLWGAKFLAAYRF